MKISRMNVFTYVYIYIIYKVDGTVPLSDNGWSCNYGVSVPGKKCCVIGVDGQNSQLQSKTECEAMASTAQSLAYWGWVPLDYNSKPYTCCENDYLYIGCYADTPNRALNDQYRNSGHSVESCSDACSGHNYFAIQYGSHCFCEDSWSQIIQYGVSAGCSANGTGGSWANSVYKFAWSPVPPTDCVGIRSIAHNKYVSVDSNGDVNANSDVLYLWETFDLLYNSDSDSYFIYSKPWDKYLFAQETNGQLTSCSLGSPPIEVMAFIISNCPDDEDCWSLQSKVYGKYMVAESNGEVNANRNTLSSWGKFQIIQTTCYCDCASDAAKTIDPHVERHIYSEYGFIICVAIILFIVVNNLFICYWCFCNDKNKIRYQSVDKLEDEKEII